MVIWGQDDEKPATLNPSPKQDSPEVLLKVGLGVYVASYKADFQRAMFPGNLYSAGLVFFYYLMRLERNTDSYKELSLREGIECRYIVATGSLLTATYVNMYKFTNFESELDVSLYSKYWNRQYFMRKCFIHFFAVWQKNLTLPWVNLATEERFIQWDC